MPYFFRDNDPRKHDMPPTELKIVMLRKGVTQKDVANELKVTSQAVNLVVNNNATSHRIRKAIAKAIGMDLKRIWPSTYLYESGPRKPGRPANCQTSTENQRTQ